jgi:hypothetical protein
MVSVLLSGADAESNSASMRRTAAIAAARLEAGAAFCEIA